MNIEQASALYYFQLITNEELTDVAMQALLNGVESECLTSLAFETEKIMSTVGPLFEACLKELGLHEKTRESHSIEAAKYYAKSFLAGDLSVDAFGYKVGLISNYKSAPEILKEICKNAVWHDECATEYGYPEGFMATRKECEEQITKLAKRLCT
ncbi:hypothetical protein [Atopomonas hussainii]|uniref:hypothetical protein n=1 Tax=Atopomonas hussainii TaxID=1429083 RepID=UPI000943A64C|nr:hypothetical protein [Atopomonas hussainii]